MIYKVSVHLVIVIIASVLILLIKKSRLEDEKRKHQLLMFHVGVWLLFFIMEFRWIYVLPSQVDLMRVISAFDALLFLPGMLLYAYVACRLKPGNFTIKFYHLLPSSIHVIVALCLLAIGKEYYVFIYDQRSLKLYYSLFEFSTLMFNGYFLIRTMFLVLQSKKGPDSSQRVFLAIFQKYIVVLLAAFLLGGVAWSVRNFTAEGFSWIYESSRFLVMIGIGYLSYCLIFRWEAMDFQVEPPRSYQRLDEFSISILQQKVAALVEEEQIFLNDQLTLADFSKRIATSPNDLSWLLNNTYGKSFYEFLNQYRIRFFLEKIHENAHEDRTILALAMESGFRSNATFYKAFKAETGQTPNQYIKRLQEVEV
ncbi:MAG: AraC family transcriptional regulator [Cytophagales bacterium]|nr:AraC family transcriptional regulator [Cytophagales bacterium]